MKNAVLGFALVIGTTLAFVAPLAGQGRRGEAVLLRLRRAPCPGCLTAIRTCRDSGILRRLPILSLHLHAAAAVAVQREAVVLRVGRTAGVGWRRWGDCGIWRLRRRRQPDYRSARRKDPV